MKAKKTKKLISLCLSAVLAVSGFTHPVMGSGFENAGFEAEELQPEDMDTPESKSSAPFEAGPEGTTEEAPFEAEVLGATEDDANGIANTDVATPGPGDFSFSGGTINGLTTTYLNSLNAEQKKNIQLVIPAKIGETPVTAIGTSAFRSEFNNNYTGCHFTSVDLTQAANLTTIGNNAFYGEPLAGNLTIPEGVTTIGEHAFRDCTSLTGTLSLPSTLKTIAQYAFSNCGFSGTLTLPENLETIGDSAFRGSKPVGYSGELRIPASVSSLGVSAFNEQSQITSLIFEGDRLTQLPNGAFRDMTSLTGAVRIPDSVQSIGENTFNNTNIKTIYLPKLKDPANTTLIKSNTFGLYSTTKLNAIVCDKDDFDRIQTQAGDQFKAKVGYETEIKFIHNGGTITESSHLFNRAYYYQKDANGVWAPDGSYKFPKITDDDGNTMAWGLTQTSVQPVPVNAIIKYKSLYAFKPLPEPQYTFSPDIEKTYDGLPAKLSVEASHPSYHGMSGLQLGDVVFYYTWCWGTINYTPSVLEGFDENSYEFEDIRAPWQIACTVQIKAYTVTSFNENGGPRVSLFHTTTHDFSVYMQPAEPNLHPILPGKVNIADGFPTITLAGGDAPGTITWDAGQQLQEGIHSYDWTFSPSQNAEDDYNYKTANGTAVIHAVNGEVSPVYIQKPDHGRIEIPASAADLPIKDLKLEFYPDEGYQLETIWMDDIDITDQISGNTLTLTDVQREHRIRASFSPKPAPPAPPAPPAVDETPNIIEKPTESKPDQPTTAEPARPIYTDNQGTGTLEESKIETVIRAAEETAKAEGHETGIAVSIPVQNVSDSSDLSIRLPEETLDTLIEHQVNHMDIRAEGQLSYHLPQETIAELSRQSKGYGIIISASPLAELPDEAAAVVGARPAYDITIISQADGQPVPITNLNGRTLVLKIPYALVENEEASKVYSTYIDDAGKIHWLKASYLTEEQAVNFDLKHLSSYGVGYLDMNATPVSVTGKDTKSVTIRWNKDANAQGYTIWYRSEKDKTSRRKIITGTDQLTCTFNRLTPGTKYFFTVRPWVLTEDGYVFGPQSATVRGTTKPQAAKIKTVSVISGKPKVVLTGPAAGAVKYSMCYSKTADFKEFKVGIRTKYTTRSFSKALPAGTYYVRVKAYRDLGGGKRIYGDWSNTVKVAVAIS